MRTLSSGLVAALVGLVWSGGTARADVIVNGGFESPHLAPASSLAIPAGSNTLAPWVVGNGGVTLISQNGAGLIGPAFEGTQFLELEAGGVPGAISQTFPTVPGHPYVLTFAYANDYASGPPVASAFVRVFSGSTDLLVPATITHGTSAPGDLHWIVFTGSFTATQSSATLDFRSPAEANPGILIDGVAVNDVTPVPEPSTLALMIARLVTTALLRKRYA